MFWGVGAFHPDGLNLHPLVIEEEGRQVQEEALWEEALSGEEVRYWGVLGCLQPGPSSSLPLHCPQGCLWTSASMTCTCQLSSSRPSSGSSLSPCSPLTSTPTLWASSVSVPSSLSFALLLDLGWIRSRRVWPLLHRQSAGVSPLASCWGFLN